MWKVEVIVRLKEQILDPEGKAVEGALSSLGYNESRSVRTGKFFEFVLECQSGRGEAEAKVDAICDQLLANPVIEDYSFELTEVS